MIENHGCFAVELGADLRVQSSFFLIYFLKQTIQGKFEDFKRSVVAKAEQFSEVDNFAKRLVAEGHTDTVVIKEQQDILRCVIIIELKL